MDVKREGRRVRLREMKKKNKMNIDWHEGTVEKDKNGKIKRREKMVPSKLR